MWANAWDVFHLTPSRGGRGRRAAVNFVVCFGCGGISFFSFFFFERTRPAASMRPLCLIYLSTSNIPIEASEFWSQRHKAYILLTAVVFNFLIKYYCCRL